MKKSFKLMMLIAVNLALLILLTDFSEVRSYALNLGENGERIASLQKALKEKGYYGGEINGLYDFTTRKAVKSFKNINNIEENEDYKTFSALDLYAANFRCFRADVEFLAKHLKSKGLIEYHEMVTECEDIMQKSKNSSVYRFVLDLTDDIYKLMTEKPNSEQYAAAFEAVKRKEINPTPF